MEKHKIKNAKERVLVTGATGFVGFHLCKKLMDDGYEVIALARDKKEAGRLKPNRRLKIVRGNLINFEEIYRILKRNKPVGIFHLAAALPSKFNNSNAFFKSNVEGTYNLLEACRRLVIKKIIYSSSMSVYGSIYGRKMGDSVAESQPAKPYDFYSFSKFIGEEFCRFYAKQFNLNIIILRYSGIYGPGKKDGAVSNFITNAVSGRVLKILHNVNWDIVYVSDVVKANLAAYKKSVKMRFEIINVGGGREINIKELAENILEISGSKAKIKIEKKISLAKPPHFNYNIAKAKRILKYEPITVSEGLSRYIKEIKNNIK